MRKRSFITRNWCLLMLQIQKKAILARVAFNIFNLSDNINALQTIKQIFFQDQILFGKRLFCINDVTNVDLILYDVCCFC